jgi:predicted nucleotide-binding protein
MPRINQELLEKLKKKLGIGQAQVYKLIAQKASETFLPSHLAAIKLAGEKGISVNRYARPEELAEIRQARAESSSAGAVTHQEGTKFSSKAMTKQAPKTRGRGTAVFVVHGRNEHLRKELFDFLRSINLRPLEWNKAIEFSKKPSPYVGEIIDAAFNKAAAIVILFTPDDEARLRKQFCRRNDPRYESQPTGQARPNVLFEAGMAFGRRPENTVLVQIGELRPFSDIAGRHIVNLDNSTKKRQELITKLRNAGCDVDDSGTDWHDTGNFEN